MAKRVSRVYLGYEEEEINLKNQILSTFMTNKIGGFPNWPPSKDKVNFTEKCPLCGLHRLLVTQCYAPLENSIYHRTLYIFACINPNCWIQSESWVCLRVQYADETNQQTDTVVAMPTVESNLSWCSGADDWDENDNGDMANGNVMNVDNDNAASLFNEMQRNSDEDEESNSLDMESVETVLGNLQIYDAHNANMTPIQGAVGGAVGPPAAAELEGGDEPGLVTAETPTLANNDAQLLRLLNQTASLPPDIRSCLTEMQMQFVPKYIYVEEEFKKRPANDDKVLELLNKYKQENELGSPTAEGSGGGEGAAGDEEQYEEAAPLHGDALFHAFLSKLHENPGQILRYSREQGPLLGAALPPSPLSPDSPPLPAACARCGSPLICELQLLPQFASALALLPKHTKLSHLHFLSVLVFTCAESCWQQDDTYVQENLVFQPEII